MEGRCMVADYIRIYYESTHHKDAVLTRCSLTIGLSLKPDIYGEGRPFYHEGVLLRSHRCESFFCCSSF